jgi:hypothetical protein
VSHAPSLDGRPELDPATRVALQQSAGAMTSEVFDQFLRRRINQVYFGVFVGLALDALLTLASVSDDFNSVSHDRGRSAGRRGRGGGRPAARLDRLVVAFEDPVAEVRAPALDVAATIGDVVRAAVHLELQRNNALDPVRSDRGRASMAGPFPRWRSPPTSGPRTASGRSPRVSSCTSRSRLNRVPCWRR